MKIAYLACEQTLPNSKRRREDALEHDQTLAALRPVFNGYGADIDDISWDDPSADWSAYDGIIIGTTWDYQDRIDEFFERLEEISRHAPLFNPLSMARWNSRKNYLKDFEKWGVLTIPTLWLEPGDEIDLSDIYEKLDTDQLVFKRQIGANSEGQFRINKSAPGPLPEISNAMMVQPFLKSIETHGEYSLIFIDGDFSHGLIKHPARGDYRVQMSYGGSESVYHPEPEIIETARHVLEPLGEMPLYARIDMVRNNAGALCLMELELIEPFLYPLQGPELGERLYRGLEKRIK